MLSTTMTRERSAMYRGRALAAVRSGPSNMPMPWAMVAVTWPGSVDGGEVDEPRAVRKAVGQRARRLDGEARLADPAGSGQRHESGLLEELDERRASSSSRPDGTRSADRAGCPTRAAPVRSGGKSVGESGDVELAEALGSRDVAQDVSAEIAQGRTVREGVLDQRRRGLGQHDLAAMARGGDPSGTVHVEPAVVVTGKVRLARMEAHPDADRIVPGPRFSGQRALRIGRGRRPRRWPPGRPRRSRLPRSGRWSRRSRRSTAADQADMPRVDGIPVRSEGTCVAHRAFDVGPQERDRPGRQSHVWVLSRSASVASIAIAASGRSRRITVRPSPPMTSVRTLPPSATTVATRGLRAQDRELADVVALAVRPERLVPCRPSHDGRRGLGPRR